MVFEGFAPAERHSASSNAGSCGGQAEWERVARERERDKGGGKKRGRESERTREPGSRFVEERRARWGGGAGRPYETFHAYAWYVHTTYVYVRTRESQLKTNDREKAAKYVDETTIHDFIPGWNNNRDESEKKTHVWREKCTRESSLYQRVKF